MSARAMPLPTSQVPSDLNYLFVHLPVGEFSTTACMDEALACQNVGRQGQMELHSCH